MENEWNNSSRVGAIHSALNRLPHDMTATGMGFKLTHNPTTCIRCKAYIAILELDALLSGYEVRELQEKESITSDN